MDTFCLLLVGETNKERKKNYIWGGKKDWNKYILDSRKKERKKERKRNK